MVAPHPLDDVQEELLEEDSEVILAITPEHTRVVLGQRCLLRHILWQYEAYLRASGCDRALAQLRNILSDPTRWALEMDEEIPERADGHCRWPNCRRQFGLDQREDLRDHEIHCPERPVGAIPKAPPPKKTRKKTMTEELETQGHATFRPDRGPTTLEHLARLRAWSYSQRFGRLYVTQRQWRLWQAAKVFGEDVQGFAAPPRVVEVVRPEPLGPLYALDGNGPALRNFYMKARAMTRLKGGTWSPPTLIPLRQFIPTVEQTRQQLGEWARISPLAALPDGARITRCKRKKGSQIRAGKRQRAAEWRDGRAQQAMQDHQDEERQALQEYRDYLDRLRSKENRRAITTTEENQDDALAKAIPIPSVRGPHFCPPLRISRPTAADEVPDETDEDKLMARDEEIEEEVRQHIAKLEQEWQDERNRELAEREATLKLRRRRREQIAAAGSTVDEAYPCRGKSKHYQQFLRTPTTTGTW